jgi:hypothetical protein
MNPSVPNTSMSQPIPVQNDAQRGEALQQFEQKFGPFDPPPQYKFEPEFNTPAPRPIPAEMYQGPYCRRRRMVIIAMFSVGIVLLICHSFPFVRSLGLYLLPLQYLHWLAVFLLAMSGVGWFSYYVFRGPLAYVEEGVPLVARIVAVLFRVKAMFHGEPVGFEYIVTFQHRDPVTGEVVLSYATHEVTAMAKDRVTLSYQVGDYVTAVYLRGNPAKSLRLYGSLDLRPDLGVIPRGAPNQPSQANQTSVIRLIGTIGAGGGCFLMVVWAVFAFGKFTPLEFSFYNLGVPLLIGAVLVGGWLRYRARCARKARDTVEESNQAEAAEGGAIKPPSQTKVGLFGRGRIKNAFFTFGFAMLGGAVVVSLAFTLNAVFDSSPVVFRPIRIREMWMVTHDFVYREYEIEYQLADDPGRETHRWLTTPSHMELWGGFRGGFAHVRRGFLGWPWVETLTPSKPKALGAKK